MKRRYLKYDEGLYQQKTMLHLLLHRLVEGVLPVTASMANGVLGASLKIRLRHAVSQLPSYSLGSVWIYLVGAPPFVGMGRRSAVAEFAGGAEYLNFLSRQFAKQERGDLAAVILATAPFSRDHQVANPGSVSSSDVTSEAFGNPNCPGAAASQLLFLRRPAQLSLREPVIR